MRRETLLQQARLSQKLREHPRKHGFRYTEDASRALLGILFDCLADENPAFLDLFFPSGKPAHDQPLSLSKAQGAVDGAEYTAAARGKPCGHIFRADEATYSCKTCTADDTCVLCSRCFEASDHEGHQVYVSLSLGSSGCCDCGDPEAWVNPISCSIHAPLCEEEDAFKGKDETTLRQPLAPALQQSIRSTISKALDYICDVFSCSPENMRLSKHEETIRRNEEKARLNSDAYGGRENVEEKSEFALVLWNDEKHTVHEVQEQVARACRKSKRFGHNKAMEIDAVGRSIIEYSRDLPDLLRKAQILEQINVTVTIRSSRDTFREQMCGTIVDWLSDISGCSVGGDPDILVHTVCEEMLRPWRLGSNAINLSIAKHGLSDQAKSDDRLVQLSLQNRVWAAREAARQARVEMQMEAGDPRSPTVFLPGQQRRQPANDDDDDDTVDGDTQGDGEAEGMDIDEATTDAAAEYEFGDEDLGEMDGDDGMNIEERTGFIDILSAHLAQSARQREASQQPSTTRSDSDEEMSDESPQRNPDELLTRVSKPWIQPKQDGISAPSYWCLPNRKEGSPLPNPVPIEEDLERRVRVDFLVLYDLRMWKTLRIQLRNLHTATVVRIPRFKRILSLRFAAVYTWLAQLYLVADREPDHSIILLSLQMLTTPTITAEIVERGNFFTKLLAILYTFVTRRGVGKPEHVDLNARVAFEAGVMTNRRIHHFFNDMKYLLESPHVQHQIRLRDEYLLQFLDFIKLFQGICPNVRAVGEHVEYENDAFYNAGDIVRDVTKMTRQFCEAFLWTKSQDPTSICRAIRQTAKSTIINSLGAEDDSTDQTDAVGETKFKTVQPYPAELATPPYSLPHHRFIVDFAVEKEAMSFHHVLHYTLSWLIDCGKSMALEQLQGLLEFSHPQLTSADRRSPTSPKTAALGSLQYLLAMFDVPLRVCAWLVQIKAGMWVRNGLTLRHQMQIFRSTVQRDVSAQRDIFLLQVAFVVCPPDVFLASVIDRFGMSEWMRGELRVREGWEDHQMMDVAEDFLHLLCIILTDRALLRPTEEEPEPEGLAAKRDIAHALCFKPMSHSDLRGKLTMKVANMDNFDSILNDVATFRPPNGLQDSGIFELKDEYFDVVDPYNAYYNKNQREEAESAWRQHKAKKFGLGPDEVVYEPTISPIRTGVFSRLGSFTQTPLFAQVIYSSLDLTLSHSALPNIPRTRFEGLLPVILHLAMLAIMEDKSSGTHAQPRISFIDLVLETGIQVPGKPSRTILELFFTILQLDAYQDTAKAKIRRIVQMLNEKRPLFFDSSVKSLPIKLQSVKLDSAASDKNLEQAKKKKHAQERQAKVLAAFKKQQNEFIEHQNIESDPEDWSDIENDIDRHSPEFVKKTWSFPRDTCIFCQEDTNDQRLYGTLSYINDSRIFRATNIRDRDLLDEVENVPTNLDQSSQDNRPFGIANKNTEFVAKIAANSTVHVSERRGLGRGYPPSQTSSGPVLTGCGHVMHYSCFEVFNAATERRQSMQMMRNHPEQLHLREFVCPLCRALGNAFLPIIWKPKDVIQAHSLEATSFEQWLASRVSFAVDRMLEPPSYSKTFLNHIRETLLPGYASRLSPTPDRPTSSSDFLAASHWTVPAFLAQTSGQASSRDQSNSLLGAQEVAAAELVKAYKRLQSTMRANKLYSEHWTAKGPTSDHFGNADVLARTLGYSIAAIEIAQRGVDSAGYPSYLDKVPVQTLGHLKVLSETNFSYQALSGLHTFNRSEAHDSVRKQVYQLFGHQSYFENGQGSTTGPTAWSSAPSKTEYCPLLYEDSFIFLAESSVYMIPYLHLDMQHVMRLCYFVEILKVTVAFLSDSEATVAKINERQGGVDSDRWQQSSSHASEMFSSYVQCILDHMRTTHRPTTSPSEISTLANPNQRFRFDQFLRFALSGYALTFLRKCLLLFHVRGHVDFVGTPSNTLSEPELDRLSKMLSLPSLDSMIESFTTPAKTSTYLHKLTKHWLSHWSTHRDQGHGPLYFHHSLFHSQNPSVHPPHHPTFPGGYRPSVEDAETIHPRFSLLNAASESPEQGIFHLSSQPPPPAAPPHVTNDTALRLPHPGIYELVALPQTHDILNAISINRRCPNTGRELSDPNLCLLCGALICGQALCCTVDGQGGCFRHMRECGGNIGLFLNVRRCAVLMLSGRNGSFFAAPYLDVHGETDWGLKRRLVLHLNAKRYDRLFREVWLGHGVPSAVARRLEGEGANTGGWETT